MATEIERKFLVLDDSWRAAVARTVEMRQGYLASDPACSVRVRLEGDDARLNIKSATLGISRQEYEYPIPRGDAEAMLNDLCGGRSVAKRRHYVPAGEHTFEVDEFLERNAGLVVAEIELAAVDERFPHPPWLGAEVSDDQRYYNVRLIEAPYDTW